MIPIQRIHKLDTLELKETDRYRFKSYEMMEWRWICRVEALPMKRIGRLSDLACMYVQTGGNKSSYGIYCLALYHDESRCLSVDLDLGRHCKSRITLQQASEIEPTALHNMTVHDDLHGQCILSFIRSRAVGYKQA